MSDAGPWRPSGRGAAVAAQKEAEAKLRADKPKYLGERWRVFGIALSRMMITIVTFGIARFWMTTRLRRHYWSSIEIGGAPLEYTGRASEKLIGFLIAVAILAVYLVVVNLALTFVGLSFFQGNPLALQLPLLALLPFIPWAQYRARRYILARTRWRGIRFGMDPGAWGYAGRWLLWWLATIFTVGLLYPLMQLKLSRYATARSYYGDLPFEQRGQLGPLFRAWLWVWIAVPVVLVGVGAYGISLATGEVEISETMPVWITGVGTVAYLWIFIAGIRYQVFSFRYLNSHKVLAERTWFEFKLGVWAAIGIYFVGGIVIQFGVMLFALLSTGAAALILAGFGLDLSAFEGVMDGELPALGSVYAMILIFAAYLPAIAAWVAFSQAFITHPLLSEIAFSTRIHGLEHAGRARQRDHDQQAEAGGFADALGADVGGAF
ncbi:MAG: DUF898 family protein [Pseudomonadota bacterium]